MQFLFVSPLEMLNFSSPAMRGSRFYWGSFPPPSFPPSLLPSFPPSLLPSFLPSFLPSLPPSVLPSFLPSLPPSLLPSVLLPATANSRSEWAPPDFNYELQIRVGTPDFNPELQSSGHHQNINRYRQLQNGGYLR